MSGAASLAPARAAALPTPTPCPSLPAGKHLPQDTGGQQTARLPGAAAGAQAAEHATRRRRRRLRPHAHPGACSHPGVNRRQHRRARHGVPSLWLLPLLLCRCVQPLQLLSPCLCLPCRAPIALLVPALPCDCPPLVTDPPPPPSSQVASPVGRSGVSPRYSYSPMSPLSRSFDRVRGWAGGQAGAVWAVGEQARLMRLPPCSFLACASLCSSPLGRSPLVGLRSVEMPCWCSPQAMPL